MTPARPPPDPPEKLAPGVLRVHRILWVAHIVTIFAFAVVLTVLERPQAPDEALALLPILAVLALALAAASLFLAPVLARRRRLDYLAATLVRYACAEGVGVLGLLLGFSGADLRYPFAFLGAAGLLILIQPPSEDAYQRHRADLLRG